MRQIYHLVTKAAWDAQPGGAYRAESLATEGFIHCSNESQVAWAANKFYADQAELLVLVIDAEKVGDKLRDEDPGIGQTFPHIYGPIELDWIADMEPVRRGADGRWEY